MLIALTKKEKLILEYIRVYTEIHGFSPSLYEIKDHFELKAVSTVHEHIANLKGKGYIAKEMSQARSIKVIDTVLADQQFLEIPVSLVLNQNSVLVEITGEMPSVYFHRSQLAIEGKYLALRINSDLYNAFGILNGDYLVFLEDTSYAEGHRILACVNDKFYYLGELTRVGKNKTFAKYDQYKSVIRNFVPKGKFIGLFRDLRKQK
jgi:repressor LexA